MELTIVPVTAENRAEAEALAVAPEQSGFIETVPQCMSEANEYPNWRPVLICHGGKPVGFSMYGYFDYGEEGRLWFDRLLIDQRYQGHGYGSHAVHVLLERMRREYAPQDIYLSVYDDNPGAIGLYQAYGFRFNGDLDYNGEKVMVLKAGQPLPDL